MNKGWSMKKFLNNMVLIVVLVVGILFTLAGCKAETDVYGNKTIESSECFYQIGSSEMVYAKDTKVIYYRDWYGYQGYMAPYYNEHGQLCRYVDGQIIPIE